MLLPPPRRSSRSRRGRRMACGRSKCACRSRRQRCRSISTNRLKEGGYPARIRTLADWTRTSSATVTPRGNRRTSTRQQAAEWRGRTAVRDRSEIPPRTDTRRRPYGAMWLPRLDLNQEPTVPKTAVLPITPRGSAGDESSHRRDEIQAEVGSHVGFAAPGRLESAPESRAAASNRLSLLSHRIACVCVSIRRVAG